MEIQDTQRLQEQVASCKNILNDIRLLATNEAHTADFVSLAAVYEHKFNQLYARLDEFYEHKFNQLVESLQQDRPTQSTLKIDTKSNEQELPSCIISKTTSSIASVSLFDTDDTTFEFTHGIYDGEWIFGIDSSHHESISIRIEDLKPVINVLQTLQSMKKSITAKVHK